ncbi:MAG: hypothetical protein AB1646_10885 [Thermodesulfobacteriota bacterium]
MKRIAVSLIGWLCLLVPAASCFGAAPEPVADKPRDGVYEITLKTPDSKKITLDEMMRDRDLNPGALFRVKTGGYISFDEADWVDKIEFKVFDIPVQAMPEYRKFARILVDINLNLIRISEALGRHDQLAFRLMNLCDKSAFTDLKAIDENIVQQLEIYRRLVLLRALVVNSLNRFVRDRSCVDKYKEYSDDLKRYKEQLTRFSRDYEALKERALATALEKGRVPDKPGAADRPGAK